MKLIIVASALHILIWSTNILRGTVVHLTRISHRILADTGLDYGDEILSSSVVEVR